MHIILVTGISGSGKSICLTALEDVCYYCVDNLPPHLLKDLISYLKSKGVDRVAVAIDARSGDALVQTPHILTSLRDQDNDVRLLFLSANTDVLLARFSETRRRHPLLMNISNSSRTSLAAAIENERVLLANLATLGCQIDTSSLSANHLRHRVKQLANCSFDQLVITFQSFGYKRGLPLDADFIFDVRTLPNPYYDDHLREMTGLDEAVQQFFSKIIEAKETIEDISCYISKRLARFCNGNRSYLTVAIGCTGGQHRSVYVADALAVLFKENYHVISWHRELV